MSDSKCCKWATANGTISADGQTISLYAVGPGGFTTGEAGRVAAVATPAGGHQYVPASRHPTCLDRER